MRTVSGCYVVIIKTITQLNFDIELMLFGIAGLPRHALNFTADYCKCIWTLQFRT